MNFGIPNSRIPRKYKKENPRTPKKKDTKNSRIP